MFEAMSKSQSCCRDVVPRLPCVASPCSMLCPGLVMDRCLEEKTEDPDMSKECKTEVVRVMNEKAKDYRLNYRLTHACEQDIPRLCDNVCSTVPGMICGGLVLHCLQVGACV